MIPSTDTSALFRCAVQVRSNHMDRILLNITHPTEKGTSAMAFPIRDGKGKASLSASFLLLLDIMKDECGATLKADGIISSEHVRRGDRFGTDRRASKRNVDDADWIPRPPPAMKCEFDLGVTEKVGSKGGRYLSVVFMSLVFSFEGLVRLSCERMNNGPIPQETGRDPEASGIWRTAPRHQGSAAATARCGRLRTGTK